jgi:hypothetical protein
MHLSDCRLGRAVPRAGYVMLATVIIETTKNTINYFHPDMILPSILPFGTVQGMHGPHFGIYPGPDPYGGNRVCPAAQNVPFLIIAT